jgi:iron complex outermembrane receptor protein
VTVRFFDDRLAITGGLRYTDDKVRLNNYALDAPNVCQIGFALGAPCKPVVGLPSPVLRAEAKADDISGKVTAQYSLTDDVNIYATYSTGYKGPMISYPRGQPLLPVRPETVKNYEAGIKGAFLERRLIATAAVFRTEYTNFQGQTLYVDPNNPASRSLVTTNAGGLKTSGFEGDVVFRVTPELTVRGGFAYTPTEFIDFAIPCNDRFANPSTTPGQCTYRSPQAPDTLQFNAGGYPLPYSPKYSFNLGATYLRPVGDGKVLGISLNYNWRDKTYTGVADPGSIVPSYGLLGANVSFGPQDGPWRINVFARNLLDKYFVTGIFRTPLDTGAAGTTPLSTIGYANIPSIESSRTVGVKLEVNF